MSSNLQREKMEILILQYIVNFLIWLSDKSAVEVLLAISVRDAQSYDEYQIIVHLCTFASIDIDLQLLMNINIRAL
jgi:hypothetical protein